MERFMDLHARVSQRLKLRDLRLLLSVAQWGSMAKAAAQLNLTQSGVSRAIADMEHTLGVRLFDRTSQGVEPTIYGQALRKWGNAVFDDLRQGVKEIEFLADPASGELRIGCAEPMLSGLLPAIIGPLYRQYPRIDFQVTGLSTSPQQYRELRERNVDLILGRMLHPLDEDLEAQVLYEERTFVVAGSHNRWSRRRKIELSELIDEPWAIPSPSAVVGSLFVDMFRRMNLKVPRIAVTSTSIQLHAAMVETGLFLSLFPGSLLRFGAKRLAVKVLPVNLPIVPSPVGIVTLKNRTLSPVTQLFIDSAQKTARPLAR
jgi:DNA-binding transcriptional LysR family regulator